MKICFKGIFAVLVFVILSLLSIKCEAQTKEIENIKKEQEKIKKDIDYANKRLKETNARKRLTTNQIRLINRKIRERENLIRNYGKEIGIIDNEIKSNKEKIDSLNKKIKILRKTYAGTIRGYYKLVKNKGDVITFIFSANTINQVYLRIRYVREFMKYQKDIYNELEKNILIIEKRNNELRQMINDRKMLVNEIESEKNKYIADKNTKSKQIRRLSENERRIRKEIKRKKKIQIDLGKEIAEILKEEREKAGRRIRLTPEERIISKQFGENRGSLPWPSRTGIIIDEFGEKAHPVLKNIKVRNDGIDIMTGKGEKARSVFQGTVSRVVAIPGANEVVIIKHGEYMTLYQNLVNVRVRNGQEVKTKEEIGEIFTDKEKNETILHFEIWKGRQVQNPEKWITSEKTSKK